MKLLKPVFFGKLITDLFYILFLFATVEFKYDINIYIFSVAFLVDMILTAILVIKYRILSKDMIFSYALSVIFSIYIMITLTDGLSQLLVVQSMVMAFLGPLSSIKMYNKLKTRPNVLIE